MPTNRLMLTALGGWLDSRVFFDTLPDGGLTIEEWKHRAALGRDHEVKVVYSGFLLPFGHKASLIKLTERKLAPGTGGTAAYLFQRMFIAVREPEKRFRTDSRVVDGRRLNLVMPFVTVRILTRVTPMLDEPQSLVGGGGGFIFEPHVLDAPFLFKLVAVDLENNIVEFSAPLVFMERDRNEGNLLDAAPRRIQHQLRGPPRVRSTRPARRICGERAAGRHDPLDPVGDLRCEDGAVPQIASAGRAALRAAAQAKPRPSFRR